MTNNEDALKMTHFRERLVESFINYEDRIAALRVEITMLSQRLDEEKRKNAEYENVVPEKPEEPVQDD